MSFVKFKLKNLITRKEMAVRIRTDRVHIMISSVFDLAGKDNKRKFEEEFPLGSTDILCAGVEWYG